MIPPIYPLKISLRDTHYFDVESAKILKHLMSHFLNYCNYCKKISPKITVELPHRQDRDGSNEK